MERLFQTHRIRRSAEAAPLWRMTTLDEGGLEAPVSMPVPGVWETHPRLRHYRGRAVYEQTLQCGGNVRLQFGGVSFRARVLMDGQELCRHYGAYTAFDAVAENLTAGSHLLQVEVDNRFGEDSALHVINDYYSYGGITRPVLVEEVAQAYITALHVTPLYTDCGWHAKVEAKVRSLTDAPTTYQLCIAVEGQPEIQLQCAFAGREEITLCTTVDCAGVVPWQPLKPKLYRISAVLEADGQPVDDLMDRFGFRRVEVLGKDILFNGEKLLLKGFNRHEDYGAFGCAVPLSAMQQDLDLMLDLGCNCVRTCHYPNDPLFLDLCDEAGLLVWEESHARGLSEKQMRNPHFMEQTLLCTREMVRQHYNHPAIFIWGCLNECADDCEFGADCYRQVYSLLHQLDSSRPMTAALLERAGGRVYGDSDVVSINMYPKWYYDGSVAGQLDAKLKEINAGGGMGKPVIISEIGAGAIYGFHDPFGRAKWSEERQADILREQLEVLLPHPDVSGVFLWQFADCRVCDECFAGRPRSYNNKGIVDEYRRPKLAYQVVRELFRQQKD